MREASPRLGRGLATLLGQAATEADRRPSTLRNIPVDDLEPNPHQPRAAMDPQSLHELADSIRQRGLLQPLLVREIDGSRGQFQIIAGERRWRAARGAGLVQVPCLVVSMEDQEASLAALVENLQRQDLAPLDEAEGFRRLLERFGFSHESLATALGKSRSHVANTLRLLNLPAAVLDHLQAGRITAGHARALLAHHDPVATARKVIDRGLSVRETEALATAESATGRSESPERPVDPDLAALERDLSQKLGLKVTIADRRGSGRVTLHYRSLDQLDGLLALLKRS
jgi:ParB family chromosome partitioning protein